MRNISIALLFFMGVLFGAQAFAGQIERQGDNTTLYTSNDFDLLTVSTTTMSGYSDYVQIRANGSAIEIISEPQLQRGYDVWAGRISKDAMKPIASATKAMLSIQSESKNSAPCPPTIPDAPINEITMIKDGQRHNWNASSCQTAKKWQALNNSIRTAVSRVMKQVP